jgi:hypothetical protein
VGCIQEPSDDSRPSLFTDSWGYTAWRILACLTCLIDYVPHRLVDSTQVLCNFLHLDQRTFYKSVCGLHSAMLISDLEDITGPKLLMSSIYWYSLDFKHIHTDDGKHKIPFVKVVRMTSRIRFLLGLRTWLSTCFVLGFEWWSNSAFYVCHGLCSAKCIGYFIYLHGSEKLPKTLVSDMEKVFKRSGGTGIRTYRALNLLLGDR